LHNSLCGLENEAKTNKHRELLNDMNVTYIAHYIIQTTERFVKRRISSSSGRYDALTLTTPEIINDVIDIVHYMGYDKIKTLNMIDKDKEIIDFYGCHNINVKLNIHENTKKIF
jgi:hypothetical protein